MHQQPEQYDPLIDEFFQAFEAHRDFAQAAHVIAKLRADPDAPPVYPLWATYFTGILAEERDRDWAKAEQCHRQVLAANPPALLRTHVLLALGITYDRQARWAESIQLCEESANLWQQTGHPLRQAIVLRQIAMSYANGYSAGEFGAPVLQLAQERCQTALAILQAAQTSTQADLLYEPNLPLYLAATWQVLGELHSLLGEYQVAIAAFQHYLTISTMRNDAGRIAYAQWNLADTYQLAGADYWAEALHLYSNALTIFQERQESYYAFSILASQGALYQKVGDFQQAFRCYEASLALVEKVRQGISSEAARSGFFATVVNIYANATLAQLAVNNLAQAFDLMERSRARTFLDRLSSGAVSFAEQVDGAPLVLAEVQARLAPDVLLFAYYTTGLHKGAGGYSTEQQMTHSVLALPAKTLLFVVTKTALAVHDLGFSPNTLFTADFDQVVEAHFLHPSIRRTLYGKLIAPVEQLLQGKQRLYIIPHGPLHYIPFQALLAADGETLLREGGPEIVYGPSATILFRSQARPAATPTNACLAIGYNGAADAQLRFAEAEAGFIAHLAGGQALVGPTTKKAAIYQQAPTCRVLHFSCHGEFDPAAPLASRLHIGAGETLTGQEIIDHLHLTCDLVTLSACESGLSLVQRGDELYGLLRAFMYAGAPALIATLWRVDERSTLIFAERFYQEVAAGASYAAALKAAQLFLKTLTRPAALAILQRHLATAIDQVLPIDATPLPINTGDALHLAEHYLKGLQTKAVGQSSQPTSAQFTQEALQAEAADYLFADPAYWAPFILVGAP